MAVFSLTDAKVWVAEYDFSGDANNLSLTAGAEELDATVFGLGGYRKRIAGFKTWSMDLAGFADYGDGEPDTEFFGDLATADQAVTVTPGGATTGNVTYFSKAIQLSYETGATIGEIMPFSMQAQGRGTPLVRGKLLEPGSTARTATSGGNAGTEIEAVASGESVYGALHVLAASGTSPSLTVLIQSSATSNGTFTTRITFDAASGTTSQFKSTAGPITDTFWRAYWTISGTSPSFTFVVAAGVA